ncbi:MAG: hypothetical protein LJE84_03495 [Gammaproteobacteria bacterium]|jgi:hypothetical protein|nr:hypothetical protein [Gammaproteobacteria bacterium]
MSAAAATEYVGLFTIAGEGVVCAVRDDGCLKYYDRRGLQHRIIERQKAGLEVSAEQQALRELNALLERGLRLAN